MVNAALSNIFLLAISLAFFLDAINADALCSAKSMIRENYEGQSSEMAASCINEQLLFDNPLNTTENNVYQQHKNSSQHLYLIDEDSFSLAAPSIFFQDASVSLYTALRNVQTDPYISLFDFYSLRKLQI